MVTSLKTEIHGDGEPFGVQSPLHALFLAFNPIGSIHTVGHLFKSYLNMYYNI
jgi:hypothetical protein